MAHAVQCAVTGQCTNVLSTPPGRAAPLRSLGFPWYLLPVAFLKATESHCFYFIFQLDWYS